MIIAEYANNMPLGLLTVTLFLVLVSPRYFLHKAIIFFAEDFLTVRCWRVTHAV
jgi:hypothetical protein